MAGDGGDILYYEATIPNLFLVLCRILGIGLGIEVIGIMEFELTEIKSNSSEYPIILQNSLVPRRFPRIWAIGNLEILQTRLVGFFCSTRCPGEVILRTYDLARALRDAGIPVIGGFHSPMEKECLDLAGEYLSRPQDRQKIALAGYHLVHQQHTFHHFVDRIIALIR